MRKYAEKAAKAAKIAVTVILFLFCAADTAAVSQAVCSGMLRCINTVIPSLFAMMAVSSVIVRSGIAELMPKWIGRISFFLFGMDETEFPIFSFGMLAGYPVGVKMLCELYTAGRISRRRAELLSGLCFGAGPAFIFGCVSRQYFGCERIGLLILISAVSANIVTALGASFFLRRTAEKQPRPRRSVTISAEMLTESVLRSGRAMADICIMVVGAAVFTAFLIRTGTMAAAGELLGKLLRLGREGGEALTAALIDVTNIGSSTGGGHLLLPYVSGAVSFGGACVFFQLRALTAGKLSLKPFIIMRAAAAMISFWVCRALLPYFVFGEAMEAASVRVRGHGTDSAVPSVMLIIMVVMLMLEYGNKRGESSAYST